MLLNRRTIDLKGLQISVCKLFLKGWFWFQSHPNGTVNKVPTSSEPKKRKHHSANLFNEQFLTKPATGLGAFLDLIHFCN